MSDDMPKAIGTAEAFAQLSAAWWRVVESAVPPLSEHAAGRAIRATAWAVHYRATVVGRDAALRDYYGDGPRQENAT